MGYLFDTLYIEFNIRPTQYKEGIAHFNMFKDDEEVKQFEAENQAFMTEYEKDVKALPAYIQTRKDHIIETLTGIDATPDARGLLSS